MSNLIDQNPVILDTGASTQIISSYMFITKIMWVDYNNDIADGDQVVLKDMAGKTVWEARVTGTGAGVPLSPGAESSFVPPLPVKGMIATTVTHGKVYIYLTNTTIPLSA
jgi:hypothetical protein